ncbi:GIY-YIG nuclease family protein [Chryseobacterium koreense]|uniref:GIY-YIG nuclease family protein n=1 Tax=Chryseobacterium koreense TaxID=232216 RepID=UPI001618F7A6|nr:GIY-YIG nuclease family protein [Chryseobacterium koreense]MBB5332473.1 putative endonuclease [Chryseobacterium koreense]
MPFYVYVIKSQLNGHLYKGQTENLEKRLSEHNAGRNRSTRPFLPWELVYFEKFETREEAVLREKYFKSGSGREFLKKVLSES